jgi:hypothetical protein
MEYLDTRNTDPKVFHQHRVCRLNPRKSRLPENERRCLNTSWPVVGMIPSSSTLGVIARTFDICVVSAFS